MTEQVSQYSIQQVQEAHQQLTQANDKFASGDLEGAIEACNELLERYPDYFKARVLTAVIHMQQGNYSAAFPQLVRASLLNSNDGELMCNLGRAYLELNAFSHATEALERSVSLTPDSPMAHHLVGEIALSRSEFCRAIQSFERSLELEPTNTGASIRLAYCLVKIGRTAEALERYKSVFKTPLNDDLKGLMYLQLGEFPELADELDIFEQTDHQTDVEPPSNTTLFAPGIPLHAISRDFAKGVVLDLRKQHQQAWQVLCVANKKVAEATRAPRDTYFTQEEELVAKAERWAPGPQTPKSRKTKGPLVLFFLGPSRSGKTTAENLIASLDGVEKGLESSLIADVAKCISQRAGLLTEHLLVNLPSELDDQISHLFQKKIEKLAPKARLVTITHPGAISDVGRLSDVVPNARFVLLKRNYDDTAFRIFAHLYRPHTNQYAYDIKDIYRYLELYEHMVDIWAEKLDANLLVLSYEDMVGDPDAAVKRIAELCGQKAPANLDVQIANDQGCATPYKAWLHAARDEEA